MSEGNVLRKNFPSVPYFIKKGKHLVPMFLKFGMELTTTLTEKLKGCNTWSWYRFLKEGLDERLKENG